MKSNGDEPIEVLASATLHSEVPETAATKEASCKDGIVHEIGAVSHEYSQRFVDSLFAPVAVFVASLLDALLRAEVLERDVDIPLTRPLGSS